MVKTPEESSPAAPVGGTGRDDGRAMARALAGGLAYFAVVMLFGFVLGAARVLVITPCLDLALRPFLGRSAAPAVAVLAELPLMLFLSWRVCGWAVRRFRIPPKVLTRLTMGVAAFGLLMIAEGGLAMMLGRSVVEFLADLRTPPGALGLLAQMAFAAFPALRRP